ncbi:hypothetical protein BDW74DRAFT_171249 [Aspergillus multicolor]|uniref:elongation of very long chain fatty acids protein n=1 Tax=Aspergillus multicolor TaxID=41759 RepID=UPI003CCD821A
MSLPIPMPSLSHPFGIHLWPHFSRAFTALTGKTPSEFHLQPGVTPMTTLQGTLVSLATYYVVIFGGRQLMKNQAPFKLQTLFIIHNFILTLISGGLLALFLEQILPTLRQDGVLHAICDARGGWTDELVLLYYLNYLTKYLELADTVFLVLKKKPLTFLHTYHHGATALLCYVELVGRTSVSWVPITLNLTVHVVMYWYYFQSARGIKIWWKRYITILQIAQFVIDIGFIYFASYTYFASTYFPWAPNTGHCMGEEYAAAFGVFIISSYLLLFVSFYATTYKQAAPRLLSSARALGGKKGL